MYTLSDEIVATLRHILTARIEHCCSENFIAWTSAQAIVEHALTGNMECLKEYDYLLTLEDCELEERKVIQ